MVGMDPGQNSDRAAKHVVEEPKQEVVHVIIQRR